MFRKCFKVHPQIKYHLLFLLCSVLYAHREKARPKEESRPSWNIILTTYTLHSTLYTIHYTYIPAVNCAAAAELGCFHKFLLLLLPALLCFASFALSLALDGWAWQAQQSEQQRVLKSEAEILLLEEVRRTNCWRVRIEDRPPPPPPIMGSNMPFEEALMAMIAMMVVLVFILIFYCFLPCYKVYTIITIKWNHVSPQSALS